VGWVCDFWKFSYIASCFLFAASSLVSEAFGKVQVMIAVGNVEVDWVSMFFPLCAFVLESTSRCQGGT
jgi:hypothetical protein